MNFSEILKQAIVLAKQVYQARMARHTKDDSPIVASGSIPSTVKMRTIEETRLDAFLKAQPPSVVYMLTAIMYLGRGDFDAKALRDQYEELRETFGGKEWASRQMLEKLLLPDYLEQGQKALSQARVDTDQLIAD
jgi:hypothetical protein